MRKIALPVIVASVLGVALWFGHGTDAPTGGPKPGSQHDAKSAVLPVSSVLQVRPSSGSRVVASSPGVAAWAKPASPVIAQLRSGRDYANLYRSLEAAMPTAENLYARAEIYWRCARTQYREQAAAEKRAQFVHWLADRDPANMQQRLAAYDRAAVDACNGLAIGPFDEATMRRMLAEAAEAGDVRAQAWQLAERIERKRYDDPRSSGYEVTATDFEQALRLIESGDPDVIADLQGVLSSTLQNAGIRIGGVPIDQGAFHAALDLLACDAGGQCGPDTPQLLRECAYQGRCAAGTVYEYTFYYGSSPATAQTIDAYRRQLGAMMAAGDLSQLTRVDEAGVSGYSMTFGGRRIFPGNSANPPPADPSPPRKTLASRRPLPDAGG